MNTNPKTVPWECNEDQIGHALSPFGIRISGSQISQICAYVNLILKWNRFTSLTTITDPIEIVGRHFGESMFLSSSLSVNKGRLADVGSGSGFPGLALKIINSDLQVTLIESNKKKAAFLSEVVRTLGLSGVEVLASRFEELRPGIIPFDFIAARAIGGFPQLLRWSQTALSHQGQLALWVGGEDMGKILNTAGWGWSPATRIPESLRRFILIGRPVDK